MSDFAVGDAVKIKIYRFWRSGRVTWVGHARVEVEYATPKGVKPRRRSFFPKRLVKHEGEP